MMMRLAVPMRALGVLVLLLATAAPGRSDDFEQAQELSREGRHEAALEAVRRLTEHDPGHIKGLILEGMILAQMGRIEDAIEHFGRLARQHPDLAIPRNNLGVLYATQKRYQEAQAALLRAVEIDPNYDAALINLGIVYVNLAKRAYERAYELNPENAQARNAARFFESLPGVESAPLPSPSDPEPPPDSSASPPPTAPVATAPEAATPSGIASGAAAPSGIASEATAPSGIASETTTPSSIASGATAPSGITSEATAPSSIASETTTPSSIASGATAPSGITSGADAPSGTDSDAVTATTECFVVDSRVEEDEAASMRRWLESSGAVVRTEPLTEDVLVHYRVYLPPFPSARAANRKVAELTARGVSDVARIVRGELRNGVGLGAYRRRANTDARLAELRKLGYEPVVSPRYRTRTSMRVIAALPPSADIDASEFAGAFDGRSLNAAPCG